MQIFELIRQRVTALREENNCSPIEAVDSITASEAELDRLISGANYFAIKVDREKILKGVRYYRNILNRVESIDEGLYTGPGMENGYALGVNEDTCWGTYYSRLTTRLGEEDLLRVEEECNIVVQQFLPQPAQSPDRRGLAIGQVQSGKTTVFNGIISAAADLEYNFVLVLSGTIESLRKQTQKRILKDVTQPWAEQQNASSYFTWISNHDGPGLAVAGRASVQLPNLGNPNKREIAIGVFLKNNYVLKSLRDFLNTVSPVDRGNLRVLIIDDECDQATPNAGVNKNTITAINRSVKSFVVPMSTNPCASQTRTSYLGFTATPFANLLNEAGDKTLYPRDFLYFLRSSNRYFGPMQLFGNPEEVEGDESIQPLGVIRLLNEEDIEGSVPTRGRPRPLYKPSITPGLQAAIRWYVLATTARRLRDPECWSTMLVHTSSGTQDHEDLAKVIRIFRDQLSEDFENNTNAWRSLWEDETNEVGVEDVSASLPDYGHPLPAEPPIWSEFSDNIKGIIEKIKVKIDNSLYTGPERLVFDEEMDSDERLQIGIGGNTLSRGMTLEGLVSSFFARRTSSYDTLLQMGRWFGFRSDYECLPRLWTTLELKAGFRDLSIMEVNLRNTMQIYLQGESPAGKAPVISKMPSMAITRKSVLGQTVVAEADFSGTAPQTIMFRNDYDWLHNNVEVAESLLEDIDPFVSKRRTRESRVVFEGVPKERVTRFLSNFYFWPKTNTFNQNHLLQFIDRNEQEYEEWSVVLYGGNSDRDFGIANTTVKMNVRTKLKDQSSKLIDLKSLRATVDLLSDRHDLLPPKPFKSKDLWAIRKRNELNPTVIIYPIDKDSRRTLARKSVRTNLEAAEHVIGLSLILNPPSASAGIRGIQLNLQDVYENDADADENPDLVTPF